MDLRQAFDELVKKVNVSNSKPNLDEAQHAFDVLKKELRLDEDKISNLKNNLNKAEEENFELQKQHDFTKAKLRETEFKLKLTSSKVDFLENKLKNISDEYTKISIKEKMMEFELQTLNENLEKLLRDKLKMSRENHELTESLKSFEALKTVVADKQNETILLLNSVKENFKKYEIDHSSIQNISKVLSVAEDFKKKNAFLLNKMNKMDEDYAALKNNFIQVSAKCEKFEKLIDVNKFNPIDKVIISQYKIRCQQLQEQAASDSSSLETISKAFNDQMKNNKKLLAEIERLKEKIIEKQDNPE